MSETDIVRRGATVVFTVTFTDINGDPTMPDSANLYLSYQRGRKRATETIPMTPQVTTWTAEWESEVADAGQCDWHVRSVGQNNAALQGSFRVDTNRANPDI